MVSRKNLESLSIKITTFKAHFIQSVATWNAYAVYCLLSVRV